MEHGEFAVTDFVFDLAGLDVSVVVVGVGLERGQRAQAPQRESRRERQRLKRHRQRSRARKGSRTRAHPGRGTQASRLLAGTPARYSRFVSMHAQPGQVVDRLADRGGHSGSLVVNRVVCGDPCSLDAIAIGVADQIWHARGGCSGSPPSRIGRHSKQVCQDSTGLEFAGT